MRIILLGPPGAGKGTQALTLASKLGVPHISTGEIMRAAIKEGTELGNKIKGILDAGELVSDDLVVDLVIDRVSRSDCMSGYILDGFPRTLGQAEAFTKRFDPEGECKVLELLVPENVLIERIKARSEQGSGRSDDSVEVAAKRLQVYWEQTAPVSNFYRKHSKVLEVDGLGSIEEVQEKIFKVLNIN